MSDLLETYKSMVDYEALDDVKRRAMELFADTLKYPERLGIRVVPESLGLTAIACDYAGVGEDYLIVSNIEELGTKSLVADGMRRDVRDGVRDKLEIADAVALETGLHTGYEGPPQDAMMMSLLDLSAMGADPFLYHDLIASGDSNWFTSDKKRTEHLLLGFRKTADKAKVAVPHGETSEMKDLINPESLYLAGASLGLVKPKSRLVTGYRIQEGDVIYGIECDTPQSNGIGKLRRIAASLKDGYLTKLPDGRSFGQAILVPTPVYTPAITDMLNEGVDVKFLQPITGHGWAKIMRHKRPFTYEIEYVPKPPIVLEAAIEWGKDGFDVSDFENYKTWDMAIGYVVISTPQDGHKIDEITQRHGFRYYELGRVKAGDRKVIIGPKNVTYTPKDII